MDERDALENYPAKDNTDGRQLGFNRDRPLRDWIAILTAVALGETPERVSELFDVPLREVLLVQSEYSYVIDLLRTRGSAVAGRMLNTAAPYAVNVLVGLMDSNDERVRLRAANAVLEKSMRADAPVENELVKILRELKQKPKRTVKIKLPEVYVDEPEGTDTQSDD